MIHIEEHKSLKEFNTMRVDVQARYFVAVTSVQELQEVLRSQRFASITKFILGGGSNILFTHDFEGLVIHIAITGRDIVQEDHESIVVELGAGENWHEFVMWAVGAGYIGVENLALIPGTVGGAPVQNIGAYGRELSDTFVSLDAIDMKTGDEMTFTKETCDFGYRASIFKTDLKDKVVITRVRLRLLKQGDLETSYYSQGKFYDSIQSELEQQSGSGPYTPQDVARAVITIRTRKLPDPLESPTVGSFFVNPIVSQEKYKELLAQDKELQFYPTDDPDRVKIPAGRLLQNLGWLEKKIGNCYMHPEHALIVTHNGKATGRELLAFVQAVQADFKDAYGIELESEVRIA